MKETDRLSKVMASRGICSRREADRYIEKGFVFVNGEIITRLGVKIDINAEIFLSEEGRNEQKKLLTFLLNKPIGYVSSQPEDNHKSSLSLITSSNQWLNKSTFSNIKKIYTKDIAPAGRLDIDSSGLLVLTQDGRIARHLIGENSEVEKEYLVRIKGDLTNKNLKLLNYGLRLDGQLLKEAKVTKQNKDQLKFVLKQGRKRQIRRMCELVNLKVIGLKRVRIGNVTLGNLPKGKWRILGPKEYF